MSLEVVRALVETLEPRSLLSGGAAVKLPAGFSPQQMRQAYGFDLLDYSSKHVQRGADGAGQTIAIVDAFGSATVVHDLKIFDATYGISNLDSTGNFALSIDTLGGASPTDAAWASEVALDVEWCHAIAPGAHIDLVDAPSATLVDLSSAIDYARRLAGVSVVSMSWAGDAFSGSDFSDTVLTTPRHHGPVTFIASSGDTGSPAGWPAVSPNVLQIGGTSLSTDRHGDYRGEIGWIGSNNAGNSAGTPPRTHTPDVAYNAAPSTGYAFYDSTPENGKSGWDVIGGTSAAAPQWAALIAIVNQGRALQGFAPLDGSTQTVQAIFDVPADDFHDILSGGNNQETAGPGYDPVTGRGSPIVQKLVADLIYFGHSRRHPG